MNLTYRGAVRTIADLRHEITALHATEINLMAQLADAQAEAVALRATEQNLRAELEERRLYARALCEAVDAATDFAGTVSGGASWWDDVWADHTAALDRARERISQAQAAQPARQVPDILFDSFAVLQALDEQAKRRTLAENVSDVLDAVVRLMRAASKPAQVEAPTQAESLMRQYMRETMQAESESMAKVFAVPAPKREGGEHV